MYEATRWLSENKGVLSASSSEMSNSYQASRGAEAHHIVFQSRQSSKKLVSVGLQEKLSDKQKLGGAEDRDLTPDEQKDLELLKA